MSFCRICRTEDNLKYTLKELRRINKKLGNDAKDLLYTAPSTQTGNICYDCEDRLHNFDKLAADNASGIDCEDAGREESPVIVDDDELLYNLFFNKNNMETNRPQTDLSSRRDFTQHSLGSDGDTEIIEVLTSSRESTPSNEDITHHFVPNMKPIPISMDTLEKKIFMKNNDKPQDIRCKVESEKLLPKIVLEEERNHRKRKRYSESETKLVASLNLLSSDSETEAEPPKKKATKLKCSICELEFNNLIALQTHQTIHNSVICPVCKASFNISQRLIHHLRTKHRSYAGDTLTERPKCSQDSAMTIRLRYLQRYTYYECQLCGQIDAVFKDHKSHVVTQHAAESKSLKDPMMKDLKCPICKEKCGTQYMELCKHLLVEHKDKHATHMKEVSHIHPFGWSTDRKQKIESSARVFQFSSRKSRYFECNMCGKVSPGYFNHWKHLGTHGYGSDEKSDYENIDKSVKVEKRKHTSETTKKNESILPKKQPKIINNSPDPTKTLQSKLLKKNKVLPKNSKKSLQALLVRVKVKPILRQIPTQKYNCKYCLLKFKGFSKLNLHLIQAHSDIEFSTHRNTNGYKNKNLKNDLNYSHHKRKCRITSGSHENHQMNVDENCNTDCKRIRLSLTSVDNISQNNLKKHHDHNDNSKWLRDLMQFIKWQEPNHVRTHQCKYCTRLFTKDSALQLHEQQHAERHEVQIIKRIALATPSTH